MQRSFGGWSAAAMVACLVAGAVSRPAEGLADDLAALAAEARAAKDDFRPVDSAVLERAAGGLRRAIGPLERLLNRSKSGPGWRSYLDWPLLKLAARGRVDGGVLSDAGLVDRLQRKFETGDAGLEMPQFARVRRALDRYREASVAAASEDAAERYASRMERLAEALEKAAASGTADDLEPVGRILDDLEATGQASELTARIRRATGRPNLLLDVDESLLATAVNRVVDQTDPVDELILGTRIRGTGRTTGLVMLDFVPSAEAAVVDIVLDATNHSQTRGTQGPVTVCSRGVTKLDARKRIVVNDVAVSEMPTEADASASTRPEGIGISRRFGQRLIRKIASRKIAEMQPRAERIAEGRAREKLRRQFAEQTAGPIAQARRDYQARFREPLEERGWFPESLQLSTSDRRLSVRARKALTSQIAAAAPPPDPDPSAVLAARVHDTMANNVAEITLAGRTITQADVEQLADKRQAAMPEAFGSDPDQPPWSITFARRRPVELDVKDDWLKVTIRGDRFASGDREFPAMDIWAAYRVEHAGGGVRLARDGDVQIYPPGFEPGGGDKLTIQETSLRRILQRRFNRIFPESVDVEPLELQGELAAAGPLPIQELRVSKNGWISAGWRKKDPSVATASDRPAASGRLVARSE